MDELAAKTTNVQVLAAKLPHTKKGSRSLSLNKILLKVLLEMLMPCSLIFLMLMIQFLQSLFKGIWLKSFGLLLPCLIKGIKELKSERVVVKSVVGDVYAFLFNILDAHDPMLSISIRWYLTEKFRPALAMLYQIEGVSESPNLPKKGGNHQKNLNILRRLMGKNRKSPMNRWLM